MKLGKQGWLPPGKRSPRGSRTRDAGPAAITSGLAAARGGAAALISRPGTRAAGAGAADAAAAAAGAGAEPRGHVRGRAAAAAAAGGSVAPGDAGGQEARGGPAGRFRTGRACLPSFLGATRHGN